MNTPAATLHVFRAGTHTATDGKRYTFSEANIADMVDSYDPALSRAPLVVGHPKLDDPAYGWAGGFVRKGGEMFATPTAVEPQFAELVNAQRFSNISLSVYLPDTPGNPKPGHYYPRHIGFLGAQPPAVKGLQRPQFADGDGAIEFAMPPARRLVGLGEILKRLFQGQRDDTIERVGVEKADQLIPQWCIDGITEATADNTDLAETDFAEAIQPEQIAMPNENNTAADFAARETELNTRATEIAQREQAVQAREAEARRNDAAEFAETLVRAGQVLPRQQAGIVELLLAFPAGSVLNFSEADGQAATDHDAQTLLRNFLGDLPARVDFAEKSSGQHNGTAAPANFAAPEGTQVDAGRMELHSKALAYQQQHPNADYITAVKAVGGR